MKYSFISECIEKINIFRLLPVSTYAYFRFEKSHSTSQIHLKSKETTHHVLGQKKSKDPRQMIQNGLELASEKMKSMEEVAQEHFKRSGSIRSSVKKSVKLQRQGSDLSDSSISSGKRSK